MQEEIREILRSSAAVKMNMAEDKAQLKQIAAAGERVLETVRQGGTIYLCGNGGSATDAMHFCEELVGRYKHERRGTKAMHFMDSGYITCWANDYEYDSVFKRQVETFCTPKDLLVLITTSGNSRNILAAAGAAKLKDCPMVILTGKDGGKIAKSYPDCIVIPSNKTEHVQEAHITLIHIFCEMIERSGLLK